MNNEPIIHSHITDVLPEEHPHAYDTIFCDHIGWVAMLHASNNECMQTWIESEKGNFCTEHFKLTRIMG